jgi:hypothetical protein
MQYQNKFITMMLVKVTYQSGLDDSLAQIASCGDEKGPVLVPINVVSADT